MQSTLSQKKNLLIERLNDNFLAFTKTLDGESNSNLIKMTGHIFSITNAYEVLVDDYPWDDECEIDFYLMFQNPLTMIAEAWEKRSSEKAEDIDEELYDFSFDDATVTEYPFARGECLTIQQYGGDYEWHM